MSSEGDLPRITCAALFAMPLAGYLGSVFSGYPVKYFGVTLPAWGAKSEAVKDTKREKGDDLSPKDRKQLTQEEKEYKSKRKQIQEKLIKFATRIPAFMYLTDFRENTLRDVITKLEPELFLSVTGLTVKDFHLLVQLKVFNTEQMNQAVFAFRRYEDASLSYTGIESHAGLSRYGLYDTVVAREAA